MSDTPKFEVIDRRKMKASEEQEALKTASTEVAGPSAGPQLVVSEPVVSRDPDLEPASSDLPDADEPELPPAPTAEESRAQKIAYDGAATRLEELVRAQNPAAGPQPPITFENLVQQFYVSAMIQMGAATQEGQRPRVDILGARQTIDLMGVLAEKTHGNLTEAEDRVLKTVLFEVRMAFLELTNMITLQGVPQPPVPPLGNR